MRSPREREFIFEPDRLPEAEAALSRLRRSGIEGHAIPAGAWNDDAHERLSNGRALTGLVDASGDEQLVVSAAPTGEVCM